MDALVSILKEIGKCLWGPIKRHATYLVCYDQNVQTLRTKLNGELELRRKDVQGDVDTARRQGQVVKSEVQQWLTDVDTIKSEAESTEDRLASTKCCIGWCWDPIQCYRLGKEAAKKISTVDELQGKGNFASVSRPPPPPPIESMLPSRGFQAFETTKSYMEQILNALKDNQIHIIGVHGLGGVGKTTLMKEVAKQVEREKLFSEIVMVTVSQNAVINNIQKEIEETLDLKVEKESKQVRAARLSKRLKEGGKPSLVILDDLWEKLELSDIGIPCGDEQNGCKVVITSRSCDVCNRMNSQIKIEVKPLIREEAWNLFQANAGSVVNSNEVSEVAKNVVVECKGLPLAIVLLGQTLTDERNVSVWNAVLERLKQSIPPDIQMQEQVFQSIEFSFDYLRSDDAKMCFLFCSLFPEDYDIKLRYITWYMIGERKIEIFETLEKAKDQVSLLFNKLMASGLLLKGEKEGSVRMHDVVRDVAIWISKRTNYGFYSKPRMGLTKWPRDVKAEDCQRMSLMHNEIDELPKGPPLPHLRTLLLSQRYTYKERRIPNTFFSQMNDLNILDLRGNSISSLPTSILCLKNLKILIMRYCPLENLDGIGALTSLEMLDLSRLKLSRNYTDYVLPTELGKLTSLRHLNLTRTMQRIPSNVISRLSSLEELHMLRGFSEWRVEGSGDTGRASFGELACLRHLTELYIYVDDERCFLQDLGALAFQKVVRFQILYGKLLRGSFDFDNELHLPTSVLPDWAQLLARKTKWLQLYSCPGMKCLIGDGGGNIPKSTFSNLKDLHLKELEDLVTFCHGAPPDGFFGNLRSLDVSSCHKLIDIFSSNIMSTIQKLLYLEAILLKDLPLLTGIWEGDVPPGSLCKLQRLSVENCGSLEYVFSPTFASALEQLEIMKLENLPRLTCIWEGDVPPRSLCKLQRLSINNCDSLEHVFSSTFASALEQLETMELQNLPRLTCIWEGDVSPGSFCKLQQLSVENCDSLEHVFSPIEMKEIIPSDLQNQSGLFLSLRELNVVGCHRLATLFSWRQVWNLSMLEELIVSHCRNMVAIIMSEEENLEEVIVDKTSVLPKLRFLRLEGLKISSFDKKGASLFDWPSLEFLFINCPNLKKLPLRQQSIPKLKWLVGSEEWFRTLEWEDENIKSRLQKLFHQMRSSSASEDDSFE